MLSLEELEDINIVKGLLKEFHEKTGSEVALNILQNFNIEKSKFIKVFPKEYQRALKQLKEETLTEEKVEIKQVEEKVEVKNNGIKDIEEVIPDQTKLDKARGFMKYKRIKGYYRDPAERSKDWKEVYDHEKIRKNVRVQASRY